MDSELPLWLIVPLAVIILIVGGWVLSILFESASLVESDEARSFREAEDQPPK